MNNFIKKAIAALTAITLVLPMSVSAQSMEKLCAGSKICWDFPFENGEPVINDTTKAAILGIENIRLTSENERAISVENTEYMDVFGEKILFVQVKQKSGNTPTKAYLANDSKFFGKFLNPGAKTGASAVTALQTLIDDQSVVLANAVKPTWVTTDNYHLDSKGKDRTTRVHVHEFSAHGKTLLTVKNGDFGWFVVEKKDSNAQPLPVTPVIPKVVTKVFYTSNDKPFPVVMNDDGKTVNVEASKQVLQAALDAGQIQKDSDVELAKEFLAYDGVVAEIFEEAVERKTLLFIKTDDKTTKVFHKEAGTHLKEKFGITKDGATRIFDKDGKKQNEVPSTIDFDNIVAPKYLLDAEKLNADNVLAYHTTNEGYTILTLSGHWYYAGKKDAPASKKFTVIFSSDDKEIGKENVGEGKNVITIPTANKSGFVFDGWTIKGSTDNKKYTTEELKDYKVTSDVTFVAVFKAEDKKNTGNTGTSTSIVTTGGGAGGYTTSIPTVSTPTTTNTQVKGDEVVREKTALFPNFAKKCDGELKNLTDPRLVAYYTTLNVIDQTNVNRDITRAEFLKLVINSANIDVSVEVITTNYSDVNADHSLAKYISYATRTGLVSGHNGVFRPNDTISRAEAAKIFVNSAGLTLSTNVTTFADVDANNSLARHIQTAYDNCLLHGRKTMDGNPIVEPRIYEPNSPITLAETAKVLYNIVHQ